MEGFGNLKFGEAKKFPTGDLPLDAVMTDFNNDGFVDLASANEGSNTITVYRNTGDNDIEFIDMKHYKIGDIPRSITSGDFNNDGWPDLASVTSNDDKLWINYNNNSDENKIFFSDAVNLTVDRSPVGITNSDLNNDGLLDIIIIHVGATIFIGDKQYTNSVSVYLNNGSGNYKDRIDYIVDKKPSGLITADFNGDGWPDVATSNSAGYSVSVLLNRGTGSGGLMNSVNYSLNYNHSSGVSLKPGDIDGDGDLDIVSITSSQNHLQILTNNGDGTFQDYREEIAGHTPRDFILADFDSDGDLDVATANMYDGSVSVKENNGDGSFSTFDFYYVGGWPRGISNGDIDNDGDLDIITANYLGGSLSIRYNDGKGKFPTRYDRRIAVEPFAVIVEDFDKDGYLDLASADEGLFELVFLYNDGDGSFQTKEKVSKSLGGYPYSIVYHDFNGDGMKDLVTSNNLQQSISILWNIGNETGDAFAPFINYSFPKQHPFGLHYGDMDGDGDDDLLCTNLGFESDPEDFISIIWNNGNKTFSGHTDYDVGVNPINLRAVDLDLDGDLDLAVANKDSNTTTVLINQNNQTFSQRKDYPIGLEPMGIEVADFDNDGHVDIITANHGNDSISILYNKGDGTFKSHLEYPNGPQPTYLSIADFNQDGNIDIAASNKLTSSISVHMDFHYPSDVSIKIGDNEIYNNPNKFSGKTTLPLLEAELNSYLKSHQNEQIQTSKGKVILVPITITSEKTGIIQLSDLDIEYIPTLDYDQDGVFDTEDDDDDNDGITDTWEDDSGLNAKNPEDAGLDADNDNLTNLQEFLNNTNPNAMDSDDDKLEDGVEVTRYKTDPLKSDTDGDGYSDYEEIEIEKTDPLDKLSYPEEEETNKFCLSPLVNYGAMVYALLMIVLFLVMIIKSRSKKENNG
jgi:hypothetical protein